MKYQFKKLKNNEDRVLLCPKCSEVLYRTDIEDFNICPYCSYSLEKTYELEDYILDPMVNYWISKIESDFIFFAVN